MNAMKNTRNKTQKKQSVVNICQSIGTNSNGFGCLQIKQTLVIGSLFNARYCRVNNLQRFIFSLKNIHLWRPQEISWDISLSY